MRVTRRYLVLGTVIAFGAALGAVAGIGSRSGVALAGLMSALPFVLAVILGGAATSTA
jgi:hypothetical protein